MNEAEWMPTPHVERERASLRRRAAFEGRASVWIAGLTSVGALISGIAVLSAFEKAHLFVAAVSVVCFFLFVASTIWLAIRDNDLIAKIGAIDRSKREEFGHGSGWLVDIAIVQGTLVTGTDRGMLWIEEGRLIFSGDRTSFSLSSDQLGGPRRWFTPTNGSKNAIRMPLRHQTETGPLSLIIHAAFGDPVSKVIDRWAESETSGGQFPPTRLGPGADSISRLSARAAFATAFCLLGSFIVRAGWSGGSVSFLFAVTAVLISAFFLKTYRVGSHWRSLRDRIRLRATLR